MLTDGKALQVDRREGEDIERLIERFNRKCRREHIKEELRKRERYTPPAEKRRTKRAAAQKREQRRMRRNKY